MRGLLRVGTVGPHPARLENPRGGLVMLLSRLAPPLHLLMILFREIIEHERLNAHEFDGDQGPFTNLTNLIDQKMSLFFEALGLICASNPWKVILAGVTVVVVLGLGLLNYQITTDPVELWSSPTSQARMEKNYFDENFGKFFRTEMMIFSIEHVVDSENKNISVNLEDL